MNGEYKMYHENGKIKVEGMYEAGKPVGTAKMYDKDGNLMKEMKTGL